MMFTPRSGQKINPAIWLVETKPKREKNACEKGWR